MQLANCVVNLGGDPRFQVPRYNVSIPEIVVLRAIHGDDGVLNIQDAGMREDEVDEYDRLVRLYGDKEEVAKQIKELFPGFNRGLPTTFKDIGVTEVLPARKKQPVDGEIIQPPKARNTLSVKAG